MSRRQRNGSAEMEVEVKFEPLSQPCADEENDGGFAGFDNITSIPCSIEAESRDFWSSHATACLISQYDKFHRFIGQSARFRSRREMFEIVSVEMKKLGYRFSPRKCENKWRVLERKYKKLLLRERLKKPGRIKHYSYWEHRRALDVIFDREKRLNYPEEHTLSAGGSSTLALGDATAESDEQSKDDQSEEAFENEARRVEKTDRSSDAGVTIAVLQSLLAEVNKSLEVAETNRERRHREKMAVREAELEVRRKLLKLKEQKIELWKTQMTAAAQSISLMK